jgi:hypothetical protein
MLSIAGVPLGAPIAQNYVAPQVSMQSLPPSKGADLRMKGVDFVGSFGSLAASVFVQALTLNARNATTFPRLSAVADVWFRYRFLKLMFLLVGKSASTQSGTIAAGTVITDGFGSITAPTTEAEVKNIENVAVARAWSSALHVVPVEDCGLKWYSSDSAPAAGGDAMGTLYSVVPQTTANNDITWDLYAIYDVELAVRVAAATIPAISSRSSERDILSEIARLKALLL